MGSFDPIRVSQIDQSVMNWLDSIEELYNMYSEEKDTLRIVEVEHNRLGFCQRANYSLLALDKENSLRASVLAINHK